MFKKLFCYLVDFETVSAGDVKSVELPFDAESDFQITNIRTDLNDDTEAKITISKNGGESISNAAFSLRALTGGNNSLNLFENVIVKRGTKWTISATVSAGTTEPLQIQFWGYKV